MMSRYSKYYDAINEIYNCLKRDLIGPVDENETLENIPPLNTYVCGILWPKKVTYEQDDEMEIIEDHEDVEELEDWVKLLDESINNANIYKPTSMGISLLLPKSATEVHIEFKGAKYKYEEEYVVSDNEDENVKNQVNLFNEISKEGESKAVEDNRKEYKKIRYIRTPFLLTSKAVIPNITGTKLIISDDNIGINITLTVRSIIDDGNKLITVAVQNIKQAKKSKSEQSANALFQCELTIISKEPLLPIYHHCDFISDIEEKITQLQYRNLKNYAHGHGCSVSYEEIDNGVYQVKSDFMPMEQVEQIMPGEIINKDILNLGYWENASPKSACEKLLLFIEEYENWYEKQKVIADKLSKSDFFDACKVVLKNIAECLVRLRKGVDVLLHNDIAWRAFVIMNEAMLLQRIKSKGVDKATVNWYPFQLAFILQTIPDIVDEYSPFRKHVDLLWFPTGGGKTEAYLGVAAFTIFYRRLSCISENSEEIDGVTVIMRYTLRLLTIQQFERACALICACEHLRIKHRIPGGEINIGLWIGSDMTPNRITQAKDVLHRLRNNEDIKKGNPVQITKCPWCNTKLDLNSYEIKDQALVIRCADNSKCAFHNHLPIYVVDEDIYRARPTFLLSTIDKFARITWEKNVRNLFSFNGRSPELIIQDELHLISGPLGSLTGIYETALEYLCEKFGKSPKIIASTATIKNSKQQVRNLYNRETFQFPAPGINYDDSFFGVKASKDDRPLRTYIGLCEMGGSLSDLLIRVYAILFYIKTLFIKQGKDPDVIDQYYTTVGYFNALKDLGTSSTIIQDRVFSHIKNLVVRTFKNESNNYGVAINDIKAYYQQAELTSRMSSQKIKETLDRLAISYNEAGSLTYVLSSNMLSVGIDIDRLGVMTVYNQPKSNAEYIQATSRVGRRNPGIVLVLFNNMRSRDKSHFEQFKYYHRIFYSYVEATSVTPFSMRAIEKALHCVFIALVRHAIPELSENESARNFKTDLPKVKEIIDYLLRRVKNIIPEHKNFAEKVLSNFAKQWEKFIEEHRNVYYKDYNGEPSILISAEENIDSELPKTLNSLRNVEPEINVFIRR